MNYKTFLNELFAGARHTMINMPSMQVGTTTAEVVDNIYLSLTVDDISIKQLADNMNLLAIKLHQEIAEKAEYQKKRDLRKMIHDRIYVPGFDPDEDDNKEFPIEPENKWKNI